MRRSDPSLVRMACVFLTVVFPLGLMAQDPQSTSSAVPVSTASSLKSTPPDGAAATPPSVDSSSVSVAQLPDSPGTERAKMQSDSQAENASQQDSSPAQQQQGNTQAQQQQTNSSSQTQAPQRPLGTAAAEAPKVNGITAAEPAGVAIAPAKQRRVRTIVLKVGAILAGGAALGAVIALSAGTSSKPPGAH